MALGAFIAGMSVGRSDYSLRAATDALPMRDAFAVLFFVSIGMLLNPVELLSAPWLVLAALGVVVIAKPLVAAVVLAVMRYPVHTVLTVPSALAQIGEFSFILAALARDLRVLPEVGLQHRGGRVDRVHPDQSRRGQGDSTGRTLAGAVAVVPEARHR